MQPNKRVRDTLDLCNDAADLLKRAGFELVNASMKTESCYYRYPGFDCVIRVATHRGKKSKYNGLDFIAARITFGTCANDAPGTTWIADDKVVNMVAMAIGHYFLTASARQQSIRAPQYGIGVNEIYV